MIAAAAKQSAISAVLDLQREAAFKFGATVRALRAMRRAGLHVEARTWAAVWAVELGGDDQAAQTLLNVVDKAPERHFVSDELVVREGERATEVFVVTRGHLRVERKGLGLVSRLSAGDTFGEGGLLQGARRMATIRAERGAGVLVLNAQQVHAVLRRLPRLHAELRGLYRGRVASQLIPKGSPLDGLDPDQLDRLLAHLKPRRVGQGQALARQDRVDDRLGIMLSGVADVWRATPGDGFETVGRLLPGDVFGAHSLLTGGPSPVNIEAVGVVEYYALLTEDCVDLFEEWPTQRDRLEALAKDRWAPAAPATELLDDLLDDGDLSVELSVMRCPFCGYEQVEGDRCMNCAALMPWVPT